MIKMRKINNLTQSQIDRFPEFVERWTKIGLCTEPADRPRAEAALYHMYAQAGLDKPRIVWCGSPLGNDLTRALVMDYKFGARVRNTVGAGIWASVRNSVVASVEASAWASIGASVRDRVRQSVWASVRESVSDSVWDSVSSSVRNIVGDTVGDSIYGQHDASWLAFYEYFREVCGLRKQTKKLSGLMELACSAGWAIPHQKLCWVSERHNAVRKDAMNRLHSLDMPAVSYPDGWNIYAVHGTLIPEEWIKDKNALTPAMALSEVNVERRRAACEILGWHRILSELKATTIDKDVDPMIRELVQVSHESIGREKFLKVLCGTGREFAIPVPPEMQTALQANAWSYGLRPDQYSPEVRT